MPRDYSWQDDALDAYRNHPFPIPVGHREQSDELCIFNVSPGAGKTKCAMRMADHDLTFGLSERVIICGPSIAVCDQWKKCAHEDFDIQLMRDVDWRSSDIPRAYKGIAITYAAMHQNTAWLKSFCRYHRTTVIFDELHYLGTQLGWGDAAREAFSVVQRKIGLTGTLWRTDRLRIPWTEDDGSGYVKDHFRFSYYKALLAGINRKILFPTLDGDVVYSLQNKVTKEKKTVRHRLSDDITEKQRSNALRTALVIQEWEKGVLNDGLKSCWVFQMLERVVALLDELRAKPKRENSAALILAMDIGHAKKIKRLFEDFFGIDAVLVHSKENDAKDKLERFKVSDRKVLIAVDMVTEGVDIKRLRVIGWASNDTTDLKLNQGAGRAYRPEDDEDDTAYIVSPQMEPFTYCEPEAPTSERSEG